MIRSLADDLVRDGSIRAGGMRYLEGCHGKAFGGGAVTFLSQLARRCSLSQEKDVLWLMEEGLPDMPPFMMGMVLNARVCMQLRLMDVDGLRESLESLDRRWKDKGMIRKDHFCHGLFKPCPTSD